MATVVFYEKPGCATNARQKRVLQQAGHTLEVRDLLKEAWTAERLRAFFGETPISTWFNPAAPQIKSGEIDPDCVDETETALSLMIAEPLLIRRPLIDAEGLKCAGFSREPVPSLLEPLENEEEDLESCRHPLSASPCPQPADPDDAGPLTAARQLPTGT